MLHRFLALIVFVASIGAFSGCCSSSYLGNSTCDENQRIAQEGWRNAHDPPPRTGPALHPALRKGMLMADVREKLGAPSRIIKREEITIWHYEQIEPEGEPLDVHFRKGRVVPLKE